MLSACGVSFEKELQKSNPPLYETFTKHQQKVRSILTGGPFLASADRFTHLENEETRLLDFAAFFRGQPQKPVLGFWEWDARLNPARFGKAVETANPAEARS
ncbi:MAG: hypothetical protein L0Z50_13830 [Verrucomicrobiales bacterium]|nr:hypothetical protein [Verrucomicrobiales bacterium]